ncbi:unnamed protein product [marine sediment metagenome]|uniref:Uncharacterized protein n=1 Tax=marine sediment metagenome TaxID=412755 RepID=X1BNL3_9ZZZZ
MNTALICYTCMSVEWVSERWESAAAYYKAKDLGISGMSNTKGRRYWTCGNCWGGEE